MLSRSLSNTSSVNREHIGHVFLFNIYYAVVFKLWDIKRTSGKINKLGQKLVVRYRFREFLSKQ